MAKLRTKIKSPELQKIRQRKVCFPLPQIHHKEVASTTQKITRCAPFFAKNPAKTPLHHAEKIYKIYRERS
jgi:hypothetical protein